MMLKTLCVAVLLVPGLALTMRSMAVQEKTDGDADKPQFKASPELVSQVGIIVQNMGAVTMREAKNDEHFRLTHLILNNLLSKEFNKGEGCGKDVAADARATLLMGLSQLVTGLCSDKHPSLNTMQLMSQPLWWNAGPAMAVDGQLSDTKCPDFSKYLKEFSFCLHMKLEQEMNVAQPSFFKKSENAGVILNKHLKHQANLKQQGAGDLLKATKVMATTKSDDDDNYGNWCGCNSCAHPDETADELPSPKTSFHMCDGKKAAIAFDGRNEVCNDHGLDAACLHHDYGAEDILSDSGPVLQCEVNRNFLNELEAMPEGDFVDDANVHEADYASSSKLWVRFQSCLQYDEDTGEMVEHNPLGNLFSIPEGKCHPNGCYLKY